MAQHPGCRWCLLELFKVLVCASQNCDRRTRHKQLKSGKDLCWPMVSGTLVHSLGSVDDGTMGRQNFTAVEVCGGGDSSLHDGQEGARAGYALQRHSPAAYCLPTCLPFRVLPPANSL